MAGTNWDELVQSLPEIPDEATPKSPLRNYELLAHALKAVVDALDTKPSAEEVLAVLESGVERLMATTCSADSTVFILDEQTRELNFAIVKGGAPSEKLKWRKLARGYGIAGWVAENASPVVANDTEYDSRFCDWFDEEIDYQTKTVLAAPIVFEGRVLGVVELINKTGKGLFTNVDLALATVFANLVGQVLNDLTNRGESTIA